MRRGGDGSKLLDREKYENTFKDIVTLINTLIYKQSQSYNHHILKLVLLESLTGTSRSECREISSQRRKS